MGDQEISRKEDQKRCGKHQKEAETGEKFPEIGRSPGGTHLLGPDRPDAETRRGRIDVAQQ